MNHANNMSRKSGFKDGFSPKGPSVECELPHHFDPLLGRCVVEIGLCPLLAEGANSDAALLVHRILPLLKVAHLS